MGLPAIPAYRQYVLTTLQMVRRRCTSSDSKQFETLCTYPTLVLDIQYSFSTNLTQSSHQDMILKIYAKIL
jgi:hypothetical protein